MGMTRPVNLLALLGRAKSKQRQSAFQPRVTLLLEGNRRDKSHLVFQMAHPGGEIRGACPVGEVVQTVEMLQTVQERTHKRNPAEHLWACVDLAKLEGLVCVLVLLRVGFKVFDAFLELGWALAQGFASMPDD